MRLSNSLSYVGSEKLCTIGYMFWSARLDLNESTECHCHDVFELAFCASGCGLLMVDDTPIDLRPNRLILVLPERQHRFVFARTQAANLKFVCITRQDHALYLSPVQVAILENLRSRGYAFSDASADTPMLRELAGLIPDGTVVGNRRQMLTVWGVVGLLLASQADADGEVSLKDSRTRHKNKVEKVCAWLNEHLGDDISLDEIALRFAFSRSLLTRSFKQHTGTSIVEYVNARRLERAAILLTSTDDGSIVNAAMDSGFSNLSHFHRLFKVTYGLTPAEFRKNFSQ